MTGIGPASSPWQGDILPLNHICISKVNDIHSHLYIIPIFPKNATVFQNKLSQFVTLIFDSLMTYAIF